ncbi:MAG TPA: TetR/AcrR family transcriptional regulator [Rhizomicrobium sp.]|jgi:AcrR family transcriptional regulator
MLSILRSDAIVVTLCVMATSSLKNNHQRVFASKPLPNIPIRQAQKDLTRSRIREAARDLFYAGGVHATSIDEIATSAGVRRSTVYLHFADKQALVRAIADEYLPRIEAHIESLNGPVPTPKQIDTWVQGFITLADREKVSLSIMREVGYVRPQTASGVDWIYDFLIQILAKRIPAFRVNTSIAPNNLERYAHAVFLIVQIDLACNRIVQGGETPLNRAMLRVANRAFYQFARSQEASSRKR